MTTQEAFAAKWAAVSGRIKTDRRCLARPPSALAWLAIKLGASGKVNAIPTPKGHWAELRYGSELESSKLKTAPVDRLARTFCALEELETWMDRVDAGQAAHRAEIEKQAAHKITRLNTFAAMGKP